MATFAGVTKQVIHSGIPDLDIKLITSTKNIFLASEFKLLNQSMNISGNILRDLPKKYIPPYLKNKMHIT